MGLKVLNLNVMILNKQLGNLIVKSFEMPYTSYFQSLSSVVSLVGTGIGILAILITFLKQKGNSFRKWSFLIMLFCLTYYCFMVFLTDSSEILNFPHFFKTGSPFFYLLGITIFWVGQSYLFGKESLGKWDYLLLLIPILNVIEFLPFFLDSRENKVAYLEDLVINRDKMIFAFEGWIPTALHFIFQLLIGLVASLYILKAVKDQKAITNAKKSVFTWLNSLAGIFLIFYITGIGLIVFDTEELPIHQMAAWLFGLMLMAQLFLLFNRPEVLYDIRSLSKEGKLSRPAITLDETAAETYRLRIETYFNTSKQFLKTEFRQEHLAAHLTLPKSRLTQIINQLYGQNFNQLINERRIGIAMEKIETNAWKNLTIEGIAQEVGFKSRTTFNKAFQEKTGLTPSQFRKKAISN